MSQLQVTFPDGSTREFEPNSTGYDVAKAISPKLAKAALAVKVDGEVRDLTAPIPSDAPVEILTFDNPEGREVFWHSSSHIMAQAVLDLFPDAKLAIGPPIDEGWYYDFEVEKPFLPKDLQAIERKMSRIIKENAEFSCQVKKRSEAIEYYRSKGADYKVEMLQEFEDETVTIYSQSRFEDLCRGPHIPRTGLIKAFKLISTSGAYWRGDEKRTMLQRIYGVSYPKQDMLDAHLKRLEEAKKRDHRILGKQLELFIVSDEIGAGLILWMPKGAAVRLLIEDFWRQEHLKNGYDIIFTPHIAKRDLWVKSGHTDFYAENMYGPLEVDERQFQLKPMNCPFHMIMYKSRLWSYRDLPLRWAELGSVYRYERPGALHGLMRVRGFTMDDAHHFVARDKIEEELAWTLGFSVHMLHSFGFDSYEIKLSTRPEKSIGDPADWEKAEAALQKALELQGLDYEVDPGEGAFYGPKVDIKIKDAIGRAWQCSTIQFDFSLPERFDLHYIDADGSQKRPYIVHRALLGSIERFFGVLIEHYAGNFPLWLAPTQVKVLPVSEVSVEYGREVVDKLKMESIRAELDSRPEKIGAKIRNAELQKVPYMFIIGAKESETGTVSLRKHGSGDQGAVSFDDALRKLKAEIESKGLAGPDRV